MNSLFDKIERTNLNFSKYQTSTFEFYNNTARPEFSEIRNTLEKWYSGFPKNDQAEFLGRFRSNNNQHLLGALLELFSHRLFSSFGYKVNRTIDSCDFIALKDGRQIFLECTLAGDPLSNEMVEQHVNLICDKLNSLNSKFFLNLSVEKSNKESPAHGKLTRWIEKKIKEIGYQEVKEELIANNSIIKWIFNSNGWLIDISLKPKSNTLASSRNMGTITSGPAVIVYSEKYIYDAIQDKRPSKYGGMSDPYVIVVNSLDPTLDDDSIIEALFKYRDSEFGFYGNSKNQKNTSVSGVLIMKGLYLTSINNPRIQYWPNPWAKYPCELPFFSQQVLDKEEPYFGFKKNEGLTPTEISEKLM